MFHVKHYNKIERNKIMINIIACDKNSNLVYTKRIKTSKKEVNDFIAEIPFTRYYIDYDTLDASETELKKLKKLIDEA